MNVTYLGALIAGLLSFLSPCVLPLVPPYLCFLGGTTFDQLTGEDETPSHVYTTVVLSSVAFVLGFTTVFVILGATATAAGQLIAENLPTLSKIAGVVIIIAGLHFLGLIHLPLLHRHQIADQRERDRKQAAGDASGHDPHGDQERKAHCRRAHQRRQRHHQQAHVHQSGLAEMIAERTQHRLHQRIGKRERGRQQRGRLHIDGEIGGDLRNERIDRTGEDGGCEHHQADDFEGGGNG